MGALVVLLPLSIRLCGGGTEYDCMRPVYCFALLHVWAAWLAVAMTTLWTLK